MSSTEGTITDNITDLPQRRPEPEHFRLEYLCLLLFLFMLYSALQSAFPALNAVRPAFTLALGALAAGILGKLSRREPFVLRAPSFFVLMFITSVILSVPGALWPREAFNTALEALKILAIFLLISNVVESTRKLNGLIWALCLGGLFPALGAIKNYINGEHLVDGNRATWLGIYGNPNDLAYAMAMIIPLALALVTTSRRLTVKVFVICAIGLYALTIFMTLSRLGFLCLVMIMVMTLLTSQQRARNILLIVVMVLVCLPFVPDNYWQRVGTITSYERDASTMGRLQAWEAGVRMFDSNPLLGVGAGCFVLGWPEDLKERYERVRTAHNTFFQCLGELGLAGTTTFCLFMLATFITIWRVQRALAMAARILPPDLFNSRYGQLAPVISALHISMWVYLVSSLTGGLLFSWYPYIFSAMAIASEQICQRIDRLED